ncbi:MAG: Na+/H+ antiporter subunit D [Deltaproteobacteria bacterium]|nr:Na+/H+ antiporter subunit D [Deltaproteobacteria bacterium]
MNGLVAAPMLVPLVTAAVCTLLRRMAVLQRGFSLVGSAVEIGVALLLLVEVNSSDYLVSNMGNWQAPFGITLVIDRLAAVMVLLTALTGAASAWYSWISLPKSALSPAFHPLLHFLLMGVSGAFITGDLFNLYVCFEIMLLSSFVMLVLEGKAEQTEGAVKYVVLNLMSSTIFLTALGLLYAKAGTLNMADISILAQEAVAEHRAGPLRLGGLLFMVAFAIKAGMFPFFFWLPASYHTPSVPVSALFAGLLTKVGVFALIRLHTLIMPNDVLGHEILLVLGVATMITGVLGAAGQMGIRRILSFHIISQVGYMVVGIAIGTPLALAACVFYLCHHIVVKSNLFLVGGIAADCAGSEDLRKTGGMWLAWPLLGLLYLVPALSLSGIPPFSGFFAKLGIVSAGVERELWWVVAAALATGAFTLYSMFKIWIEAFWKDHPSSGFRLAPEQRSFVRLWPMLALAAITIAIGLMSGPLFHFCEEAALQLLNPNGYIHAVLGGRL